MEAGSVLPADEIEQMSGVNAPKSDEEGKGLLDQRISGASWNKGH